MMRDDIACRIVCRLLKASARISFMKDETGHGALGARFSRYSTSANSSSPVAVNGDPVPNYLVKDQIICAEMQFSFNIETDAQAYV